MVNAEVPKPVIDLGTYSHMYEAYTMQHWKDSEIRCLWCNGILYFG
jgi:hypothetical protein